MCLGENLYLQVSQLPCARSNKHNNLSNAIPHRPRIRSLAQIPVSGFSLALVLLFPADSRETIVQLAQFARDGTDVCAVVLYVAFCSANNDV